MPAGYSRHSWSGGVLRHERFGKKKNNNNNHQFDIQILMHSMAGIALQLSLLCKLIDPWMATSLHSYSRKYSSYPIVLIIIWRSAALYCQIMLCIVALNGRMFAQLIYFFGMHHIINFAWSFKFLCLAHYYWCLTLFDQFPAPLQYVRHGDCFLLVYAINDRQTFEEVKAMHQWITRLRDKDMPMVKKCYIMVLYSVCTIKLKNNRLLAM